MAVYVFIDAANIWQAQKAKGRLLDYQKVLTYIKGRFGGSSVKIFYYTSYPGDGTRRYSLDDKHRFFTFLKKGLGFTVRKKELKRILILNDEGESVVVEKGNMDVEITIDAMHHIQEYDTMVLFSGDADFLALVNYLKDRGKHVYVFSSRNNISNELRTSSDGYSDILTLKEDIWFEKQSIIHKEQKL